MRTCEYCGTEGDHDNPVRPRRFSPYDREQDQTVLCRDCWADFLRSQYVSAPEP